MTSIPKAAYDYSECDEIADSLMWRHDLKPFATFDEAARFVRSQMPDETHTVIDNVAEALVAEPPPKAPIDGWGEW